MSGLKDILDKGGEGLSEEKLQAYLDGKLSPAEQHEVERWLAEEGMEGDALEGLKPVQPAETKRAVRQLNRRLRREIAGTKGKRRASVFQNRWNLLTVLIVLFLCFLAFLVIRLVLK